MPSAGAVRSTTVMPHAVGFIVTPTSYARHVAPTPLAAPHRGSLRGVLSVYRFGGGDRTTRLTHGEFWRATYTPDGAGTLHLDWRSGSVQAVAYGPGAAWLLAQVPALTGRLDPGHVFAGAHPQILAAQRDHPDVRFGASSTLYHAWVRRPLAHEPTSGCRRAPAIWPHAPRGGTTHWASKPSAPMRCVMLLATLTTSTSGPRWARRSPGNALRSFRVWVSGRWGPCWRPRWAIRMHWRWATTT